VRGDTHPLTLSQTHLFPRGARASGRQARGRARSESRMASRLLAVLLALLAAASAGAPPSEPTATSSSTEEVRGLAPAVLKKERANVERDDVEVVRTHPPMTVTRVATGDGPGMGMSRPVVPVDPNTSTRAPILQPPLPSTLSPTSAPSLANNTTTQASGQVGGFNVRSPPPSSTPHTRVRTTIAHSRMFTRTHERARVRTSTHVRSKAWSDMLACHAHACFRTSLRPHARACVCDETGPHTNFTTSHSDACHTRTA
jgi:hypothetical protein